MGRTRKVHRLFGAILLLPLLGWASTALIFFLKPGYGPAFEIPALLNYPLGPSQPPRLAPGWLEARLLRTVLGVHLLVRDDQGWHHYHLDGSPWPYSDDQARQLLDDSFAAQARYGKVAELTEGEARTVTGVRLHLNWNQLSVYQEGTDTDAINWAYRIHYLQFSGIKSLDRVLGLVGLACLVALALTGARLLLKRD